MSSVQGRGDPGSGDMKKVIIRKVEDFKPVQQPVDEPEDE